MSSEWKPIGVTHGSPVTHRHPLMSVCRFSPLPARSSLALGYFRVIPTGFIPYWTLRLKKPCAKESAAPSSTNHWEALQQKEHPANRMLFLLLI